MYNLYDVTWLFGVIYAAKYGDLCLSKQNTIICLFYIFKQVSAAPNHSRVLLFW